ncbi:MAG: tRNA (adenosine(37)-N6)-threonylcarbamoyltransferase complex dimerization subunit type 1 TsaB [Planctomycetes bacterium]|nr:tRNA (adenosine(37)-N6)-threonylcarbamoyltransferase complex dimerization subunit type 1 TsaB [Planctomycetota bacterium]
MEGVILAIETSGETGGAAVLRAGQVLADFSVSAAKKHGGEITHCVDRAMAVAKLERGAIDVVVANCGPGSYTGLRIGLTTAITLSYALDRPAVGVPCFDVMATHYSLSGDLDMRYKGELWPVLDARRDEVMTAKFMYDKGVLERVGGDELINPAEFGKKAAPGSIVFGSGIAPYIDVFKTQPVKLGPDVFNLSASSLALQAYRQLLNVAGHDKIERRLIEPRYFRRVLAKTTAQRAAENAP